MGSCEAWKRVGPHSKHAGQAFSHLGRPRPGHVGDRCPGTHGMNPLHCRRGAEHISQMIGADEEQARRGIGDGAGRGTPPRPEARNELQRPFSRPIRRLARPFPAPGPARTWPSSGPRAAPQPRPTTRGEFGITLPSLGATGSLVSRWPPPSPSPVLTYRGGNARRRPPAERGGHRGGGTSLHPVALSLQRAAGPPRGPAGQTAPYGPAEHGRGYRAPSGSVGRPEHGRRAPESRRR